MTKNKTNKLGAILMAGALFSTSFMFSEHTYANNVLDKEREKLIVEEVEGGYDINHYETINKLQNFIKNNIDDQIFASLHIDREERTSGTIVLSFTEELSPAMKEEMKAFVEEPAEVTFRLVNYTENQLIEKQREIDTAIFENQVFEAEGISVYHTATDVINNKLNIGISPFNADTTQIVYDYFGSDMIEVVEGVEFQLLTEVVDDTVEEVTTISVDVEKEEKQGFFAKIWNWLSQLFK